MKRRSPETIARHYAKIVAGDGLYVRRPGTWALIATGKVSAISWLHKAVVDAIAAAIRADRKQRNGAKR